MVVIFGAIGVGSVWGWLVGMSVRRLSLWPVVGVTIATFMLSVELIWLAGRAVMAFLLAVALAWLVQGCWRYCISQTIK